MELRTVDNETWVNLNGLWHTEYSALADARAAIDGAVHAETAAASNLRLAEILTTPEHPDSGPSLRDLVLDRLALPADADDATILDVAGAAVPVAAEGVAAAIQALNQLWEALVAYATDRRVESVAQRQFHDPDVIPVLARCVEQIRLTRLRVLAQSPIASGDDGPAGLRRCYDETVAAWEGFLRMNETSLA